MAKVVKRIVAVVVVAVVVLVGSRERMRVGDGLDIQTSFDGRG